MLNIVYDPESDLFIFMASSTNDPDVSNIDELLEAVSGEFALFASCIAGSTREAYHGLVNALEASGQDMAIKQGINELIESNEETVFLKGESKDECVESVTNMFKREIETLTEAMTSEKEGREEFADEIRTRLIGKFTSNMYDMFNVDVSHLFKEKTEDTNEDYEDDLF